MKKGTIHGIGVDIVRVSRIREAVQRWGDRFLERVFTEQERRYCFKRVNPYPSLAARFAAKEAFIKAISTTEVLSLREIETVNDSSGSPVLRLHGKAESVLGMISTNKGVHLSLSHNGDYAVAFVIIEKKLEVL